MDVLHINLTRNIQVYRAKLLVCMLSLGFLHSQMNFPIKLYYNNSGMLLLVSSLIQPASYYLTKSHLTQMSKSLDATLIP